MAPPGPLLLPLLLLLPLSSGDSCSKEVEQLRLEVESMRLENSLARDQMIREQERLKSQVEEQEVSLAALQALPHGNLPRVEVCGFTTLWEKAGARIHFDRLLVDYTNSEMPGGGDGSLNIDNGLFTCLSPGWYKVTISAYASLAVVDSKQEVLMQLYHNDQLFGYGTFYSFSTVIGRTHDQGSVTVMVHLNMNDHLDLRTSADHFTGTVHKTILCISLIAPDL